MSGEEEKSTARARRNSRKDRLIQARVSRVLEVTLKAEARRRRLSVSHLIRSLLEDTFPPPANQDDLSHVYAWNEVVLHRPATCSRCEAVIASGEHGFAGLSDDANRQRAWLCPRCIDER